VACGFFFLATFFMPTQGLEQFGALPSTTNAVLQDRMWVLVPTFSQQNRMPFPSIAVFLGDDDTWTGSRHISKVDLGTPSHWGLALWKKMRAELQLWLGTSMKHTPVLVMGLVLVVLLPPLAIVGWIFRRFSASHDLSYRLTVTKIKGGASHSGEKTFSARPGFPSDAVLILDEPEAKKATPTVYPLNWGDLVVRIGREDDNEIQIRDKTIHRYHAAIERTDDGAIAICDLSGSKGNGVRVNGKRVKRAMLKNNDRIGLGAVTLSFRLKLP